MLKKLLLSVSLICVASALLARKHTAAERLNTGNQTLDSLLTEINRTYNTMKENEIGKLELYASFNAQSWCSQEGFASKHLPDLVPFYPHSDKTFRMEGVTQMSYQKPCNLLISPLSVKTSNRRRSRRIMREVSKVLLPVYAFRRMNERGSDKSYTLPFSDDGLLLYNFSLSDSVSHRDHFYRIAFSPKKDHHTLISGYMLLNRSDLSPHMMNFSGRTDFGLLSDTLWLGRKFDRFVPIENHTRIDYRYGKSEGHNAFQTRYSHRTIVNKSDMDPRHEPLDLTDVYTPKETHYDYYYADSTRTIRRKKTLFQQLPQRMVGTSDIDAFGTDLRVYGPLNPASVGYDKFNGITLRERLRFSHLWRDGQSLVIRPEVGYSFGFQEFRYKFDTQWVYGPARRAGFRLLLQNGNSGFSSKFSNLVNNRLEEYVRKLKDDTHTTLHEGIDFDDLNLKYYHRYEFKLEHALELRNGLMLYAGSFYNYRKPVRRGSRAWNNDLNTAASQVVNDHYTDLNPYVRLEWTPRQYYHYKNLQKLYLASRYPTFKLEMAQGIKGILGSKSDYTRMELDVHQTIPLGGVRSLSYHSGGGMFFRQKGEYFINYSYFSRSQYPDNWETHIGGVFSLLDDYWYSSSPAYLQVHVMYESPFMLLHRIRPISKFVIQERVYFSQLLADGKNVYTEAGYGMGNNYFNIGVFTGFVGLQFMDAGLKFTIELDQHL
ncbi:MAG: hypothetical protein IJP70_07590 [Bacteroidales bacterium]|nr:hypothetical protein [Bacteroidales bacterium]